MQERIRPQRPERTETENVQTDASVTESSTGAKLRDDLDDLLDEIDEVLESNAEEFVKNYVQKGGE
jgi:prokaryotic ubiquitin-like protein Pup